MFTKSNGVKTPLRIGEWYYPEDYPERINEKGYEPNWHDTRPLDEKIKSACNSIDRLIKAGYDY